MLGENSDLITKQAFSKKKSAQNDELQSVKRSVKNVHGCGGGQIGLALVSLGLELGSLEHT